MNNMQLFDHLGNIDDELIIQADQNVSIKYKAKWYQLVAKVACFILGFMLLYQIPAVKAAINDILTQVQQITNNYNKDSLDIYKVKVNQSQSLNGLKMSVHEVILETGKLIIKCDFKHENSEQINDFVLPSEWPLNFKLEKSGNVIFNTNDVEDIMTAAYNTQDDSDNQVIWTIDLSEINSVTDLLGHALEMTFYYNNGLYKGQGYTFSFMPKKVYEENSFDVNKTYYAEPYGSFTVETITDEALYLDFKINSNLQSSGKKSFDFKLVDEEGTEYYQERNYDDGNIWFNRPENLKHKFYIELILYTFDEKGNGTPQLIDKYPVSWAD